MKYQTAVVLCHIQEDDFSFWIADFPTEIVEQARKSTPRCQGPLCEIIDQIPMLEEQEDMRMHFVFHKGQDLFALCMVMVDESFFLRYHYEGSSIRGSKEEIITEVQDFFLDAPQGF